MFRSILLSVVLCGFAVVAAPNASKPAKPKVSTITCAIDEIVYERVDQDHNLIQEDKSGKEYKIVDGKREDLAKDEETYRRYRTLNAPTKVRFKVQGLQGKQWELVSVSDKEDEGPIEVVAGEKNGSALTAFNDQGGDLRRGNSGKTLILVGDADGVVYTTLTLSASSGFKNGRLEVIDSSAPGPFYWSDSNVVCTVAE